MVRYIFSIVVLLLLWKFVSILLSTAVLPPPEDAFVAFGKSVKTRIFWDHFAASAFRVFMAMAVGWLFAFPLGILIGYYTKADEVLSPLVFLTYPIPKIVFLPVFLIIFGLGDLSKIFIISLIIGYQILVATRDGVKGLNKKSIDSFRSLGGGAWQTMRHVVVPSALPHGFTALRIGTGTAIAVLFFVESFATSKGLGFFIMDSWGRASYDLMFVGIIGMSLLGVLLYEIFNYLEKNLCAWKFIESGRSVHVESVQGVLGKVEVFGKMIKFSHTLFALPFALSAVVLAHRDHPVSLALLFWIVVAMVGARSAAMGFNRVVDAGFDAKNPRTADRAIPSGSMSYRSAGLFVVLFSCLFIFSAAMISRLCLILSIPVLAVLLSYSFLKRFTWLSHIYLGFSISLAPMGAWIAVADTLNGSVVWLSLALLTYIAGFDILYACQDREFDKETGLFSVPAVFGVRTAFSLSTLLHVLSFVFFLLIFVSFDMGGVYFGALVIIAVLFLVEHRLVSPDDLTNIRIAFFHVNSLISLVLFFGILFDELLR
ncbi:MAG: UbiA-like polyprenyltransferase [Desulfatiglans sp.]|nr:UbiA-like polyprenyltransferase [Thermodesulfobacteriota bacterium]MEE4354086.1 UbiA-like polyprenyltransferase [Desulfatiglans sp.]